MKHLLLAMFAVSLTLSAGAKKDAHSSDREQLRVFVGTQTPTPDYKPVLDEPDQAAFDKEIKRLGLKTVQTDTAILVYSEDDPELKPHHQYRDAMVAIKSALDKKQGIRFFASGSA